MYDENKKLYQELGISSGTFDLIKPVDDKQFDTTYNENENRRAPAGLVSVDYTKSDKDKLLQFRYKLLQVELY